MSKHERQHNLSHVVDRKISKVKRVRVENINITHRIHTDKHVHHIPCSHENNLSILRTNILTLLRMLLPQILLYYPSTLTIDYESDQSIDQLVANLIQIPSFYRPYPSI
jgi:ABC-type multidrug transport system fused ATPase/permease subunit